MYYVPDADVDAARIYQGDVFQDFPCFFLPSTDFQFLRPDGQTYSEDQLPDGWQQEELLIVRARRYKIILVSQTCDIHEEGKRNLYLDAQENYVYQLIHYCPVIPLAELQNYRPLRDAVRDKKHLNQNLPGGAFYLPAHPTGSFPDSIAYPNWVCAITKTKANRFRTFEPKQRLASLMPPFREAFANRFGQVYARVALPTGAFEDNFTDNAPQSRGATATG